MKRQLAVFVQTVATDLASHAARVLATAAVVAISVFFLVLSIGVNHGIISRVNRIMAGFGPRQFMVLARPGKANRGVGWRREQLDRVRSMFRGKALLGTYHFRKGVTARIAGHTADVIVYAADPEYLTIEEVGVTFGRNLTKEAQINGARVAVVGTSIIRRLFPGLSALPAGFKSIIGRALTLGGSQFRIVGIQRPRGVSPLGVDEDAFVWIPFTAGRRYLAMQDSVTVVRVKVDPSAPLQPTRNAIVRAFEEATAGAFDVRVIDPIHTRQMWLSQSRTLRWGAWILTAVAVLICMGISAVVTAFWVRRHTAELVMKRALGATVRRLMIESVLTWMVVAVAGAFSGAAVGVVLTHFVSVVPVAGLRVIADPLIGVEAALVGLVGYLAPAVVMLRRAVRGSVVVSRGAL